MIVIVVSLIDGDICMAYLQCLFMSYKANDKDGYYSNVVKIGFSVGMCGLVNIGQLNVEFSFELWSGFQWERKIILECLVVVCVRSFDFDLELGFFRGMWLGYFFMVLRNFMLKIMSLF